MRVLLATDGTWGDVGPLLAVTCELKQRGHDVLALLNPSFAEAAERLGVETRRVGVAWEEYLERVDHTQLMKPVSGTLRVLRDLLIPGIPAWAAASDAAVKEFAPDVGLVHHFSWGALASLHQYGLPLAATFLAPISLLSAADLGRPLAGLPPSPVPRLSRRMSKMVFRRLLDRPARSRFELAGLPAPRDVYFLAQRSARLSLALWSPMLRGPARDDPAGFHICGYAFPVEADPLSPELAAFLHAGDPPVVVTLASAREVGLELYRAAAGACARIGRRAVLLTGGEANRPDSLPEGVAAFDEAPHGALMARSCAIVHHGGAGTTGQALRAGKPGLIVPFGHDQGDNSHRARQLGGTRVVQRRRASAKRLARTLDELLTSPALQATAQNVGERVTAEDGPGNAARLIEKLA